MVWALPSKSYAVLTSPVSLFWAPIKVLYEMFSKWPLYFNQTPAAEIWSVVHLPSTFNKTESFNSLPLKGLKGSNNCKRSLSGLTLMETSELGFGAHSG